MSQASGKYKIDDNDWFNTYGFAVISGANDFLKMPSRKPSLKHDWPDENGTDIDTSTPFFSEKPISIVGALYGSDETDFWAKYDAMFAVLSAPGLRQIYVYELGRYFEVYYDSCPDWTKLTRIRTELGPRVVSKFTLNFVQPVPGSIAVAQSLWLDSNTWDDGSTWSE